MSNRPTCAQCGAKYGRRDIEEIKVSWPLGKDMPAYRGNSRLVRTHVVHSGGAHDGHGKVHGSYETWDGESWITPYEPFCTLRCALDYARKAHKRSTQIKLVNTR